jgi:ABC-type glutathione transport system ATPase component
VLLVEHDVSFVMERCDRIAVLNLGEVIAIRSRRRSSPTPGCVRRTSARSENGEMT